MYTVKLTIAYDGTSYRGWQLQKNGKTVQEVLETAIRKVFGRDHRVHGASRTDAGVHAKGQVAHFKTETRIPEKKIPAALNAYLPGDVSVIMASYEKEDFHSRFGARSKHYRYYVLNSRTKDPFRERYMTRVSYPLDTALMDREAKVLKGRHDFKAFQAADKHERSSVRTIKNIRVKRSGRVITIDVEADGFLYNMVRNISGTLIDIGRGYFEPGSMKRMLLGRDRTKAGETAPAKGLVLLEVKY